MSIEMMLAAVVIVALIGVMTLAVFLVNERIKFLERRLDLLYESHKLLSEHVFGDKEKK